GTFSDSGNFEGLVEHLDHLIELGVTHIELMPVQPFGGDRNWGYDGVSWHSVHEGYGGPRGLQKLVDTCHRKGLAVILDVV
ncbi:alpha-amylase family glycosyl hydrolase, partial [Escherichia coli]|nr:alpha-amylase family glycosyl hydrolase [Escherichia coli]